MNMNLGNRPGTGIPIIAPLSFNRPTGTQGGMTGMNMGQPTGFPTNPMTTNTTVGPNPQSNKREIEKTEIIQIIQNYLNSLNPEHPQNAYKKMVYNRVLKEHEGSIDIYRQYRQLDTGEDGVAHYNDYNLWLQALSSKELLPTFYPFQVSSIHQLYNRMNSTNVLLLSTLVYTGQLQNHLNELNNAYDNQIERLLTDINRKKDIIKEKQFNVMSKLERFAIKINKAEVNHHAQTNMIDNVSKLVNFINTNENYIPKIASQKHQLDTINFENFGPEKDFFKDFNEQRLEKCVNVLRDMKKIIEVQYGDLMENLSVTNGIRGDLEHIKRYGYLPKI
jgi:hypothetical protein